MTVKRKHSVGRRRETLGASTSTCGFGLTFMSLMTCWKSPPRAEHSLSSADRSIGVGTPDPDPDPDRVDARDSEEAVAADISPLSMDIIGVRVPLFFSSIHFTCRPRSRFRLALARRQRHTRRRSSVSRSRLESSSIPMNEMKADRSDSDLWQLNH